MGKKDYHSVLGIDKNASAEEIKTAFRRLAMKYHPDRNQGDPVAEEKFKEIREAYDALTQGPSQSNQDWNGAFDPNDLNSIFGDLFGFSVGKNGEFQAGARPQLSVDISLNDAYNGRQLRVDSSTTLNIPAGVRPGAKIFAAGRMYKINVQRHEKFQRSGDDLLVDVGLDAISAILGVDVVLEHLNGNELQFSIPAGIQQGQIVKLSGRGMKNPELEKFGDLLIRVNITIPKNITDHDKSVIKSINLHQEKLYI